MSAAVQILVGQRLRQCYGCADFGRMKRLAIAAALAVMAAAAAEMTLHKSERNIDRSAPSVISDPGVVSPGNCDMLFSRDTPVFANPAPTDTPAISTLHRGDHVPAIERTSGYIALYFNQDAAAREMPKQPLGWVRSDSAVSRGNCTLPEH